MTDSNDVEYSRLSESVQAMEKLLSDPVSAAKLGFIAKALLLNTRGQLEAVKQQQTQSKEHAKEEELLARDSVAVAQMVERESKLNSEEKQEYAGFLKQDYFTKANFSDLDHFYQNSWDKLSDGGKAQMSHRVWEGIRQGEYSFEELPETVRKKESEFIYQQFNGKVEADAGLKNIPATDRADFIREYESKNDKGVSEVLSRPVFTENVSSRTEPSLRDGSVTQKTATDLAAPAADAPVPAKELTSLAGLEKVSPVMETGNVVTPPLPATGGVKERG